MENKSFLNKLESINDQLNLTHYWIIFLKCKRVFILAPTLFGVLGFFIALNINPIFQSQATLVIEESTKNIANIEEVYGSQGPQGGFMNNNYINNQIQIIESDEVLTSVILDQKVNAKAVEMYKKISKSFLSRSKVFSFFSDEQNKKEIIDKKRISVILNKIRKESLRKNIDPVITLRIWKNMIWSYINFEKKNFRKK